MAINFNPGLTAGSINTLNSVQRSSETNYQQLSTGQRINSAADNAAGLSIATRIDAATRSVQQALRNANDGISMLQVADGALSQSTDILQRMRELTIQSANDTYGDSDRKTIDKEFNQLAQELGRTQEGAEFNGRSLFSDESISLQVGEKPSDILGITFGESNFTSLQNAGNLSTEERLAAIDNALTSVQDKQASLGATINRLDYAAENLSSSIQSSTEANSRIMDTDYAAASTERAKLDLQERVGIALLTQANADRSNVLRLLGS